MMWAMTRILTIILILMLIPAGWLYWVWHNDPLPPLDPEEWWGSSSEERTQDASVRPFKVKFSDENGPLFTCTFKWQCRKKNLDERTILVVSDGVDAKTIHELMSARKKSTNESCLDNMLMIADLKHRLANFRAPPPTLEGMASQHGFNSHYLDYWRQYWAEKYNFTEREQFFNKFPQFKTKIQGLDIHFIRIRPEAPPGVEVVPLLILHGWPGGVRELYHMIPLLTRRHPTHNFLFEVVAPSLPGFGYSDGAARPGLGCPQIAVIFKNLMDRLGYKNFYIQGGDWGGEIAADLATFYPEAVLGLHTSLSVAKHPISLALTALGGLFPSLIAEKEMVDRMTYPLVMLTLEFGYFNLFITKPDTFGIALTDSPVGLLAFLFDKLSTGTNLAYRDRPDSGLEEKFSKEQLLDIVTMHWMTRSSTTSARLYSNAFSQVLRRWRSNMKPTPVPTWALQAKYEIMYQTPTTLRFKFHNLVNVTVLHKGGHDIALEEPEIVAEDLFTAVKAFREHERNKRETV